MLPVVLAQFVCFCSILPFVRGNNWWIPNLNFSALSRRHADVICLYSLFSALYWVHSTMKNGRSVFVLMSGLYYKNGWIIGTRPVSNEDLSVRSKDRSNRYFPDTVPSLQLFSALTPLEPKVVSLCWCFTDLNEFAYLLLSFSLTTPLNGNINVCWHVACTVGTISHAAWRTTNRNSQEASLCPVHQYLVQIFQ